MAEEKKDRVKSALGGGGKKKKSEKKSAKKKSGKKIHKMHIRHAANGGYIAEHEYPQAAEGQMPEPSEEHVLPDIGALQDHVAEHMGPMQEEEPAPAAAAPAPKPGM